MTAGMPKTANGISQPNCAASTSRAKAIQYKPDVKWPNPNHHPSLNAEMRLPAFSIIKKKPLKPIIANGNINTKEDVDELKKIGLSGVMLGRRAIKNPAIFNLLKGKEIPSSEIIRKEYMELAEKYHTHAKYINKVLAGIKYRE